MLKVATMGEQHVKRFVFGSRETIAAKVYGTIVVLAVVAAGGKAFQHDLWRLVTLVVATVLVLWLSHIYASGLAESVRIGRRVNLRELATIARREVAVPLVAVIPTAVLVLGAVGLLEGRTAIRIALAIGVAVLAVQGCAMPESRASAWWVQSVLSLLTPPSASPSSS